MRGENDRLCARPLYRTAHSPSHCRRSRRVLSSAALVMAESALFRGVTVRESDIRLAPRHSATVRTTHWIVSLSFAGLLVSGIAILLAHPRLYWGETGAFGTPSLLDLPIPFSLGHSGWGRSLHFFSAWVCVLTGIVYMLSGFLTRHFRRDLMPARTELAWGQVSPVIAAHLRWSRPAEEELLRYNVLQKLTYLGVVFVLFPLIVLSGLAMSPAITSVVPLLVDGFGGQQSARTIHFFLASFLVLFVVVHIAMVCRAGFARRIRGMIASGDISDERAGR
jgi:thiosulfate reductase cytochrome b subunit